MSSIVSRGLRLALGSLFVFGAALVVAPDAHAQWTSSDACVYPTDVPELFFGTFNGDAKCEALCKQSASYCRKFVKDGAACWQSNWKGIYGIAKKSDCASIEDPAERQACNQQMDEYRSMAKEFTSEDKDSALADCDTYQANCIENCSAVVE